MCPWNSNSPFKHCEEELCAWIVQPGNTWTNIGYLVVAYLVFQDKNLENRQTKNLFVVTSTLLFFCSTLFHATGTVWGQILDMYTMLAFSMLFLTSALERYYDLKPGQTNRLFYAGLGISLLYPVVLPSGKPVFGSEILMACIFEFLLFRKKGRHLEMRNFSYALGTFGVALLCLFLDINKIVCYPQNHILPLHGVWHFLAAAAIYFMYKATVLGKNLHKG